MKQVSAIILAAGQGRRMRSTLAKVLHPVAGRPMVWYMVEAVRRVADARVVVVVGHHAEQLRAFLKHASSGGEGCDSVLQRRRLGTGHAVRQAQSVLMPGGGAASKHCLIVNGDTPLLTPAMLTRLVARHRNERAALTLLTTRVTDPGGYGRVIRGDRGRVVKVVEERDADRAERAVTEVNVGAYVVETRFLFQALAGLRPRNTQREYYVTDLVGLAVTEGRRVSVHRTADAEACLGINSRQHLAQAEQVMRRRIRTRWLAAGVTMRDPDTTFIDAQVTIGRDTVLYPGVTLEGRTTIGADCTIRSSARVTDSVVGRAVTIDDHAVIDGAVIEARAAIGPFARLRTGTVVKSRAKVGNFVELKNTVLGPDSKANHLTYLGDTSVGARVNIGAGVITCNYDGYRKARTIIEDGVFLGSDTQLIAPVTVGKGAVVGAGSTITRDVPPDALALSRPRQVNHDGGASLRLARSRHILAKGTTRVTDTARRPTVRRPTARRSKKRA